MGTLSQHDLLIDILRIVTCKDEFQVRETDLYARKSYKMFSNNGFHEFFSPICAIFPTSTFLCTDHPKTKLLSKKWVIRKYAEFSKCDAILDFRAKILHTAYKI